MKENFLEIPMLESKNNGDHSVELKSEKIWGLLSITKIFWAGNIPSLDKILYCFKNFHKDSKIICSPISNIFCENINSALMRPKTTADSLELIIIAKLGKNSSKNYLEYNTWYESVTKFNILFKIPLHKILDDI